MSGRIGGVFFCLLFMVCFGGVGVFAAYAMGSALYEGFAAQDWVRVRADVTRYGSEGVAYRYRLGDKEYAGDRIGVGFLQGSDVDDETDARLNAAVNEKKPITVFVNPDDPSKSVVDPQIPWMLMAFMTPFAFGFGGVGLGALYMLVRIASGADEKKKRKAAVPGVIKSSAGGEALGIWIFAFFWNVISFPIALVAVPDLVRSGEWLGLLILIFPLVGVLMIWGAINATIRMIRRGPAKMVLSTTEPRMGLPVSGHVAFSRGVTRGDGFRARLGAWLSPEEGNPAQVWHKDATVQAIDSPEGPRVNFRFDVPRKLGAAVDVEDYEDLKWRLELYHGQQAREAAYSFELELEVAPGLEMDEGEGELDEQAVPAGLPAGFEGLAALVGKEKLEGKLESLSNRDRARLHAVAKEMTPEQREQMAKLVKAGPLIKKLVFVAIGLFILVQIVGVVIAFAFSS